MLSIHLSLLETVQIDSNQAMFGGGLSLANSTIRDENMNPIVNFVSNRAKVGRALYIDDVSENSICSNDPITKDYSNGNGCFFENVTDDFQINFENNYASQSRYNLFGGVLDRCTVYSDKNMFVIEPSGASLFENITNIGNYSTVSSEPIRVCICRNN